VNHEEPDWILIVTTEDGELVGEAPGMLGSSPRSIPSQLLPASSVDT
jgi:hypothetical protein